MSKRRVRCSPSVHDETFVCRGPRSWRLDLIDGPARSSTLPTLVLVGTADALTATGDSRRIVELVPDAASSSSGAGHMLMYERAAGRHAHHADFARDAPPTIRPWPGRRRRLGRLT